MDIVFDRGSKEEPKGHALLYFRSRSSLEEIWVTYTVILPITVDVTKYVPPFLMNQVGELGPKELSAFAFPRLLSNLRATRRSRRWRRNGTTTYFSPERSTPPTLPRE